MKRYSILGGTAGAWFGLLTLTALPPQTTAQTVSPQPVRPNPIPAPAAPTTPSPVPVPAQPHNLTAPPQPGVPTGIAMPGTPGAMPPAAAPSELPRFDLDFPGGTPTALLRKIEESLGQPLNVIVPPEFADTEIPPLKLHHVTVPGLFSALERASAKRLKVITGYRTAPDGLTTPTFGTQSSMFGFRSQTPDDPDTVWYFYREGPETAEPPPAPSAERVARFYQLSPYLGSLKVDDITTAIQTSWKMLGETQPASLTFHKETKLLIAVGRVSQLKVIDDILTALPQDPKPAVNMDPALMRRYGLLPPEPKNPKPE